MPRPIRVGRNKRPRLRAIARSPLTFFTDFVLLLFTLSATLVCVATGYGLDAWALPLLPLCLPLALVFCGVYSLPCARDTALAVLCVGVSAALRHFWDVLPVGATAVYATARNLVSLQLNGYGVADLPQDVPPQAQGLFLLFALILLAALLGLAIVRFRSVFATFLPSFLLILPALVAETQPWWPALMVLTACWVTMLLGALTRRAAPRETARLTLIALPAVAAALALLGFFLPQKGYTQPDWSLRAYGKLVDLGAEISREYASGGLSGILPALSAGSSEVTQLSGGGPPHYSGRTMLNVTVEEAGRLYLRGCSAGVYTGESWRQLADEAYATLPVQLDLQGDGQPLYFPVGTKTSAVLPPYASVTVENVRAPSRFVYTPYDLSVHMPVANAEFSRDVGLLSGGARKHTISYFPRSLTQNPLPLFGETASSEVAYRAFVYQNYLTVPSGFMESILPWRERVYQAGLPLNITVSDVPKQFQRVLATAYGWAALLDASTSYDLRAPDPPAGRDFVEYFLNESAVGYCMHYATAATLLLRANGIPARYVSGFAVDARGGVTEVPDSSAHAWTEIYLDGYGWYPIEVTPAAGVDSTAAPGAGAPVPDKPAPDTPAPAPNPPPPPAPPAPDDGGAAEKAPLPRWLLWPVLVLAAVLIAVARRALTRRQRRARMDAAHPNAAVIAAYVYLQQLAPWGAQTTAAVEELARKAKFSQHVLRDDEYTQVLTHLQAETARMDAALSAPKRLALRYIWALY